ncbi:hypothetical protein [Symbioplanes lichenis]|uniref:hypothetical protein n=1 Tax=Symbioplanes lichenis TaxID=1629072 RepID=UPI00273852A8|nr:hypothetical protein [Actinoplanes lichenis]
MATLVSTAPSAAPSKKPAERPLIRTDTSAEEEDRLTQIWIDCMVAHGDPDYSAKKALNDGADPGQIVAQRGAPGTEAKHKQAEKACQDKEPEEIWQRAKRLDPTYPDKLRDWVTCIRSYGIDAWEDDGFLAFESLPPDPQMKKVDQCQDKVFGSA